MAQVVLDSSSDDAENEDRHLFVEWRAKACTSQLSKAAVPKAAPANIVCLDSESDEENVVTTITAPETRLPKVDALSRKPLVVGPEVEVAPAVNKRKKSPEKREQEKREEKQRKVEQKEAEKRKRLEERALRKKEKEEQKKQQQEEARQQREAEKLRKAEVKAKAAAARKLERQKEKWENGKFALENTVALIDCKVLESGGLVGGQLLSRFAEKGLKFLLVSNPIPRSIVWKVKRPSQSSDKDSQGSESDLQELQLEDADLPYVLLVFEAEEFVALIAERSRNLDDHVRGVRTQYPGFTVCYLINKLRAYLQKKDQQQYRNGESGWVKPNTDKALAELLTNYTSVHSRLCLDEAEVADHVVGLTRSLAECPFKQRLTPLSISKNGDHVVKSDPNKDVIRKNIWLKALVALPKVSGAAAIAIAKEYPTLRSLLNAYLDPAMSVHEKELLLQDIEKEPSLTGVRQSRRRVGPACSRRIYRILMAQNGDLKTEDVEEGADHFDD